MESSRKERIKDDVESNEIHGQLSIFFAFYAATLLFDVLR